MNVFYLGLLVFWIAILFFLSSIPHLGFSHIGAEPLNDFVPRKLIHSVAFALMSFLCWKSMPRMDNQPVHKAGLCFTVCVSYAIIDEVRQHFVPGRFGNIRGVFYDTLGIVFALICLYVHQLYFSNRSLKSACDQSPEQSQQRVNHRS